MRYSQPPSNATLAYILSDTLNTLSFELGNGDEQNTGKHNDEGGNNHELLELLTEISEASETVDKDEEET